MIKNFRATSVLRHTEKIKITTNVKCELYLMVKV